MKDFYRPKLALFLALLLIVTALPVSARAATSPSFRAKKSVVYENSTTKGVYSYTVTGVQKGYKVKWGITGGGKPYVKLSSKTTTAKGTTVSNKITVATNGNKAAKNKKFNVVAKVYNKSGKLVTTLKDKPAIKICAETIEIDTDKIKSLDSLEIGTGYDFDATVTPANATSKVYWTVTDAEGKDHSAEINSSGVWTPKSAGEYTITATAKNSENSKSLCTSSVKVTAGVYLKAVTQVGANQIKAVFSVSVKDKLNEDNISIEAESGVSSVVPKTFAYDAVGKTVTITTYTNLKDRTKYVLKYGSSSKAFTASVGDPVAAKITMDSVPVETLTEIEYALYDEKGIDVRNACDGEVKVDATVINGYLTEDNKLYMTTVGKKASITINYISSDGKINLTDTRTVTCVEATAEEAASTNFTITSWNTAPDYGDKDYQDVRSIALEEEGFAHFRALDKDGEEIEYDAISYSSSNDNVLIISDDGEITPIKQGTVKIIVTAEKGESKITYSYNVTVMEERKLSSITLSETSVTMSNTPYASDYQKVIGITLYDQYKREIGLADANIDVEPTGTRTEDCAYYDAERGKIVVGNTAGLSAGTYSYKVTASLGSKYVTTTFRLVIKAVPTKGAVTYVVELSDSNIDVKVDKGVTGDKKTTIRLAQYRGGVFESYENFDSATIRKSGKYFSADLTEEGDSNAITLDGGNELELTTLRLEGSSSAVGEAIKAETGSYSISLKYYNMDSNLKTASLTIKITDTQEAPTVKVDKIVADRRVSNALDLVKECMRVSAGEIYDCTVTGDTSTGEGIKVSAGEKVHIKTIRVKSVAYTGSSEVPKVYVYHTITVGKTLTNK